MSKEILNLSPKDIIQNVDSLFKPFKELVDKFPKAFIIHYDILDGYVIDCDLSLVERGLAN